MSDRKRKLHKGEEGVILRGVHAAHEVHRNLIQELREFRDSIGKKAETIQGEISDLENLARQVKDLNEERRRFKKIKEFRTRLENLKSQVGSVEAEVHPNQAEAEAEPVQSAEPTQPAVEPEAPSPTPEAVTSPLSPPEQAQVEAQQPVEVVTHEAEPQAASLDVQSTDTTQPGGERLAERPAGPTTEAPQLPQREKKEVIDIPVAIIEKILQLNGFGKRIVTLIKKDNGEMVQAVAQAEIRKLFDVVPPEVRVKLAAVIDAHGYKYDEFRALWQTQLSDAVFNVYKARIDLSIRNQAAEELGLVEKFKANWKNILIKTGLVAGGAVVAATGAGLIAGAAGAAAFSVAGWAMGSATAASGIIGRLKNWRESARRKRGEKTATENEAEEKMKTLIEKKEKEFRASVDENKVGSDTSIALAISQAIREGSAGLRSTSVAEGDLGINGQLLLERAKEQYAGILREQGNEEEAAAQEAERLVLELIKEHEIVETRQQLREKNSLAVEILKKLNEARVGRLFVSDGKEDKNKLRKAVEDIAGYVAPVAAGVGMGVALSSGAGLPARMIAGGLGLGMGGYEIGKRMDRKAQERLTKESLQKIEGEIQDQLQSYQAGQELNESQANQLESNVRKFRGHLEILRAIKSLDNPTASPARPATEWELQAEGLLWEADRALLERKRGLELLSELKKRREAINETRQEDVEDLSKKAGKWRRWVGASIGAAVGALLGYAGNEWSESRMEAKLETDLSKTIDTSVRVTGLSSEAQDKLKEKLLDQLANKSGHAGDVKNVADLSLEELQKAKEYLSGTGSKQWLQDEIQRMIPAEHVEPTVIAPPELPTLEVGDQSFKVKVPGDLESDGKWITGRGPLAAVHQLDDFMKRGGATWTRADILRAMEENGYKPLKGGGWYHPGMELKGGVKVVPFIDDQGRGHFSMVDMKGGAGFDESHGWIERPGRGFHADGRNDSVHTISAERLEATHVQVGDQHVAPNEVNIDGKTHYTLPIDNGYDVLYSPQGSRVGYIDAQGMEHWTKPPAGWTADTPESIRGAVAAIKENALHSATTVRAGTVEAAHGLPRLGAGGGGGSGGSSAASEALKMRAALSHPDMAAANKAMGTEGLVEAPDRTPSPGVVDKFGQELGVKGGGGGAAHEASTTSPVGGRQGFGDGVVRNPLKTDHAWEPAQKSSNVKVHTPKEIEEIANRLKGDGRAIVTEAATPQQTFSADQQYAAFLRQSIANELDISKRLIENDDPRLIKLSNKLALLRQNDPVFHKLLDHAGTDKNVLQEITNYHNLANNLDINEKLILGKIDDPSIVKVRIPESDTVAYIGKEGSTTVLLVDVDGTSKLPVPLGDNQKYVPGMKLDPTTGGMVETLHIQKVSGKIVPAKLESLDIS